MKTRILIVLCFALCHSPKVIAEGENEVKRGGFPYMAFIYYSDSAVVDDTGARFLRGAVLIKPEWLVTSALGPSNVNDISNGFPRKTLLARLGAVTINSNFTLNEDEDEQEREVIQIVRPYNYSVTQWWRTDISVLKTLVPFNMTPAVSATALNLIQDFTDKTCLILVYAQKFGNSSDEKTLMQYPVALLPPSIEKCGSHFVNQRMTCAADTNENPVSNSKFCHGNSGGPLVCDGEVIGLQTYIENNCRQPHLYQLLSAWDNLINCSINDKCHDEECEKVCDTINKDAPVAEVVVNTINNYTFATAATSENITTSTATPSRTDEMEIPSAHTVTIFSGEPEVSIAMHTANTTSTKSFTGNVSDEEVTEIQDWPNEKFKTQLRQLDQEEIENGRKPKVEAQRHLVNEKVRPRNAAPRDMCTFLNLLLGLFVVEYFV